MAWRLAKETLGHDPMKDVTVVFRAKRADRVKIVVWDGSGLVMYWKRFDGSGFQMASLCGGYHADEHRAVVRGSGRHGLDTHARASNPAAESTCLGNKIFAASGREAWQNRANE
ncbi:IS66 family insertion sequence element accessory protein TnpB [Bradyrhizobium sp. CB82]|uniref:IS66 family insertion sequence element accessory protein TnpB n=1 Tax=Bradyrhizobium sp. CB82 TaxID=3039159 RepID=UPI0024B1E440|nr:IS66 family insertion sequence element accessory protein TnpB [Bradyrhizobium sp. CB82]WFU39964.1 IS66 family insertion sequence element accessory protein TnpB [Bradyrhizobium sp. CB82]